MRTLVALPLLSLLWAASLAAPARTVLFTGLVTDAGTGAPIAGVQVFVESSTHGALTGSDGRYSFTGPSSPPTPSGSISRSSRAVSPWSNSSSPPTP